MAEAQRTDTFNFELVSPERKIMSEPATMVVIPGEEGDFGVLPNHSPLMSSVRPGVVLVFLPGQAAPQKIFIAGGFADVTALNTTLLAEEAVNVNELHQADIEQTIRNLNEDMTLATEETEKARVRKKLELAKAKLSAVIGHTVI
ncbi:MAG TPA: ATP synthase F1 subunit epsilon [Patescibacteria group bacterium]|jgi:F-type H+-transporting ATPase subunit epsilon|nr:ATP synthase F1 subunit epsilon [Patescibacteria group bacterium]